MNVKNLFTDEDAVSPVIGVILMVAITVILAAVIGAFVLGIGGSQETVPQATFGFDYANNSASSQDELTVRHKGGAQVNGDQLYLSVSSNDTDAEISDVQWTASPLSGSSEVTAGSSVTYKAQDTSTDPNTNKPKAELTSATLVWKSSKSDKSQVVGEWEA